ncbi:MAG: DUF1016 family protein [Bacteroidales bacterium]|nr:DUF1016 family protein [Bacteroidales bacterium]
MQDNLEIHNTDTAYNALIEHITEVVRQSRARAVRAVNSELVATNWNIGRYIVEFEQKGNARAEYGKQLIPRLSKDLTLRLGTGYSRSNLANMRLLYLRFPIFQAVLGKLNWTQLLEILPIENDIERDFYIVQTLNRHWGYRQIREQYHRGLFYQLAVAKNTDEIVSLSNSDEGDLQPKDIVKDTYFFYFLQIKTPNYSEDDLEEALVKHMEEFLLELGKGFAFIGRQYRLTIDNEDYYTDLVFYHVVLKCYVIIDLKRGKVKHEDIGQMNMYLGYFALDVNTEGDNPPIGIILAADKNDVMVKYATYGMDSNLFVAKYKLYLPEVDELRALVLAEMDKLNNNKS